MSKGQSVRLVTIDPQDDAEALCDEWTVLGYRHGSTCAVSVSTIGGFTVHRIIVTMVRDEPEAP